MTDIELDARAASSTGMAPHIAGGLAYLAGPFSGIIILLGETTNRYVRFHAWQAILGLGGVGALAAVLLLGAFLGLFISPSIFTSLNMAAAICGGVWVLVWAFCLFKAFGGSVWRMPVAGRTAERLAARIPRRV
jgi:uncharacterized membrane protein